MHDARLPQLLMLVYNADSADSSSQIVQQKNTMDHEIEVDSHLISVVRSQLTRSLNALFPELRDDIVDALTTMPGAHAHNFASLLRPILLQLPSAATFCEILAW